MAVSTYSQEIEPFKIETLTLKVGQHKTAKMSGLKIKFLGVTEDSRCPTDVQCVWAGNAKMKFRITGEKVTKDYIFNSTIGQRGDQVGVWAVSIDTLSPAPHSKKQHSRECLHSKTPDRPPDALNRSSGRRQIHHYQQQNKVGDEHRCAGVVPCDALAKEQRRQAGRA